MFIFIVAVVGAIIPTVIYVSILCWFDRYEKEPFWLMALTFLWGAIPAIILAMITELAIILPVMMAQPSGDFAEISMGVFPVAVVAPIVEEIIKAVPLLVIFLVYRHEFDGLMDGLLYGSLVGFGFAMTENFFYIFGAGAASGITAELGVFFLRTIVFGMMHALWSSMFGIGLAIARYSRSPTVAFLAPCAGLLAAMLLHGLHNFSSVMSVYGEQWAVIMGGIMFLSYGFGCISWLVLVFVAGQAEKRWIQEELRHEVTTGLLTAEQAENCGRYRSRLAARWAALWERGIGHAHRLGHLYTLCADLAFKKRQMRIHPEEQKTREEIDRLRYEITQARVELADKDYAKT